MAILRNILIITTFFIIGCTNQSNTKVVAYQADGLISISRQAPAVSNITTPESLAFMPVQFDSFWLNINSKESTINLMQGSNKIKDFKFLSKSELESGSYKILIKDNLPLWYAEDSYYQSRKLPTPIAFSSERYLKGVYGEKALFLENGWALFSNEDQSSLVAGINVEPEILNEIYQNISVDSLVVVK